MDPNEALAELRRLAVVDSWADEATAVQQWDRFTEVFTGLDNWLSNGGFLPADWQRKV